MSSVVSSELAPSASGEGNVPSSSTPRTVALVGNPNTGKSTLFSGLVGVHQHVGNYPGVTVEKKIGTMTLDGRTVEVVDLPGLYSLAPWSRDEMVVVELLLGCFSGEAAIDGVVCLADAGNLERGLYVVSQVLDLGLPTVLAVNMLDVAESRGIGVDLDRLRRQIKVPVVGIQANRRIGLVELKAALADLLTKNDGGVTSATNASTTTTACGETPLPEAFEAEVTKLQSELAEAGGIDASGRLPRYLVRRLLLDTTDKLRLHLFGGVDGRYVEQIAEARARLAAAGCPAPGVEITARYQWARRMLDGVVTQPTRHQTTATDRIDHVLTHRIWGTLVFAAVMLVMFQSVFAGARPATEWIQQTTGALGNWVSGHMAEGVFRSLLVTGIINGAGSILAFLPQILVLFAFIAVLEDCGYMARTAYLMDRMMARVGLSGKSFIPLLSSFACAVPGVMATRVIENERDRLTTILVAPLLTCSARLPVYALLIAAVIPPQHYLGGLLGLQGLTLAGLYVLGIVAAVVAALLLKRTILRGETPPFVMELPSYKWPSPRTVFFRMAERGLVFVRCAGTLILAISVLVWAALYFPHDPKATHQEQQRNSYLGMAGRVIEPVVEPLGWDWRIGCSVLASLPAREVVVATLGVMYHVDDDVAAGQGNEEGQLTAKIRSVTWDGSDRPVYTVPTALSIMVFFALCAQCAATLAVIRRETNSWRWPAFTFGYMTALAYVGALLTYQVGTWISRCCS